MKILVDRLAETPTDVAFDCDSAWWQARVPPEHALPHELSEPFRARLRAHRMGQDVFLEGLIAGSLELECSRCLKRYRHALREPFRLVLEPAGSRLPSDPEAAESLARDGICVGDELESGWFRGDEIHLGGVLFEVVSLALPVQPLCREDCPGLCPQCGADLSVATCDCAQAKPDSPFAVLAALRRGSTGGQH